MRYGFTRWITDTVASLAIVISCGWLGGVAGGAAAAGAIVLFYGVASDLRFEVTGERH